VSRFKKVFVICPSNLVTGGPDALHQMVYYLNQLSINASIVYINLSERESNVKIPEPYRCYVDNFLFEKDIIDSSEYAVIIPESLTYFHNKFSNATVFIWWLGVENHLKYSFSYKLFFTMTYPLRVLKNINHYRGKIFKTISWMWDRNIYDFSNEQQNIKHICASYYALDYVSKKTSKQTYLCIEPISKLFLTEYEKRKYNSLPRLDQVIYNPVKSGVYVDKLINKYKGIKFIPLRNMTQEELIYQYQTSKVYIDFGPFGGAERMPKEAVLYGCAILTARHGASGYYGDVSISDEYKIEEDKVSEEVVIHKIKNMIEHYELIKKDFITYKETVLSLENNFISSLESIFVARKSIDDEI